MNNPAGPTHSAAPAPRFTTLDDWLRWQETLHPNKIDLGLERVRAVWRRLHAAAPSFVVITVGGTNGKGSCVAMLEAILSAAGYRAGAYTSPHLLRYNERVRVAGEAVSDADLCAAFARVDAARGDISLTYFEFGTLAALDIFYRAGLDVAVLEVGMGGRLDAVNILDADVALLTGVDIDHAAWLGPDRESIGVEKAGIFRAGRPAVYGDDDPPQSVLEQARVLGTGLQVSGRDYHAAADTAGWRWEGGDGQTRYALPYPRLRGAYQRKNAAAVVTALAALAARLPVDQQALRLGLMTADLPGRFHILDSHALRICDVAHNPQAARTLAANLATLPPARTHAVLAMLADKDHAAVARAMSGAVHHWHVAGLEGERGTAASQLADALRAAGAADLSDYTEVAAALAGAQAAAQAGERIVVFGSFYTVAAALTPAGRALWGADTAPPVRRAG